MASTGRLANMIFHAFFRCRKARSMQYNATNAPRLATTSLCWFLIEHTLGQGQADYRRAPLQHTDLRQG